MTKARIVFDLDGALIDSAGDLRAIAKEILAGEGCQPISLQEARTLIGRGPRTCLERLCKMRRMPVDRFDDNLRTFNQRYASRFTNTQGYPNVRSVLAELASRQFSLGICTNKPTRACLAVLRHLELDRYFMKIVCGDSITEMKPSPKPLLEAFDAPGVGNKIFVGDSEIDAETSERAGIPFVLFREGHLQSPLKEDK